MGNRTLKFRHEVIDPDPPGSLHDIALIADINGDGLNDIIIGGKEGDFNLFWYENPSWKRHIMASAPNLEAGGVLLDIAGNGRLDVVAGQQMGGNKLYWFECPPDPRGLWTKHIIEDRFEKYHDQAAGDIDGDGEPEIVFISQMKGILAYYDIPRDPRVSPWPREHCHVIAEGLFDVEGLAIVDIDCDGRNEVIAGPNIFRPGATPDKLWRVESFAQDFVKTRVAVADLDGDGRPEIVLCEGESHPGRLAWCAPPDWEPRVLQDDLFHPHSLGIADFDGDGLPDIFVGEMGLGKNPDPKMIIYFNRGGAQFSKIVFERGVPTHEAKVGDLTGSGRPDIVGKPYMPERHIDVWFNET
ncbi:MAG: FG-GAP repeat domain-containing protein [bacterium]